MFSDTQHDITYERAKRYKNTSQVVLTAVLKTDDTSYFLNKVNLTAKFILYCLLWKVKHRDTVILKVIRSFGKLEIEICC